MANLHGAEGVFWREKKATVMRFRFTSIGPKGEVPKLVIYSKMRLKNYYNLSLGDKELDTDTIDDYVVTDNKDSQKVLTTVAFSVFTFTNSYPQLLSS